ncbi:glycoside hydrolase family 3 protein [Paractinoplanes brasiliensis]|uniref:Beta-N-acetylhexosaminidase n=1 Tax=Paractinoplanes brasiliensis TaxID=52695 RepID=A0A4R6JUZ7_9ACTN|nr:glycoside hydrolase family 3 N-terminal domain-containing protein [Actinoplanes brasiliensis]TDO40550.1 beta-N-acetylhexosaminidase [Actinoplanes brasiliensis]GID25620.1 sugar hydrolase [Actinoplanes brasiliensis]
MAIDPALRRLALGTLLAAFKGGNAPGWAVTLLGEGLAGHTLFGTNVADPAQVAALTAQLREGRPDALIAIDEEGGDVTRLAHRTGSPYPGNAALGAVDDEELTRTVYAAIGADLVSAGVNLDLAPTVDVNTADDNPIIGTRSFGADPQLVARHARAAVDGLQSIGVAACAKHFPGHGATVTDSHLSLPTVDVTREILDARDLPPFAAVAGTAKAVMSAHIRVPALTGDDPATFSTAALQDLLRSTLGFDGVIVTDALEMAGAAAAAGGIPQAAVRALTAGADLLCIGAEVTHELVEAVVAAIVAGVPAARLEEAVARNTALASWTAFPRTAPSVAGDLGLAAARRAVRVEGSVNDLSSPLVVQLASGHSIAEGVVPWGLAPHLDGVEQVEVVAASASAAQLTAHAGSRPIVVVGRHTHRQESNRALVEQLSAAHTVGVVEMGWPSTWRPARARAFVTTHGASLANGRAAAEALGLAAL